ncbi:MAG: pyrrolo-quinoline quinone [Planctomycetaceae bacterium]|nr:pyrrolo-quinoline quinone [Planctomycetaceae bacterium]
MGSHRDGVYRESGIVEQIPEDGLPVKWRQPIAGGYAGPAVADGRVFVFDYVRTAGEAVNNPGQRAELAGSERVTALDEATGEPLWQYEYECPYGISYPCGPRCTPTVHEGLVYTLGSEGDLICLTADAGKEVWRVSLKDDLGANTPLWGFSAHPLIDGDLLYTMVGGDGQSVAAFDRKTGKVVWKALDGPAGYCPPSIIEAGGVRQLLVYNPEAVTSVNPANGQQYWSVPIKPAYEMSIAQPMREGDRLYASGIRNEAVMIELGDDGASAEPLWRGEANQAVFASNCTPLFVDGVLYGSDCNEGCLAAVDAADGSRLWSTFKATQPDETRRVNHGTCFVTRVGDTDRYLLMAENGDLLLAKLTRDAFEPLGRFHALEPTGEAFGRSVVWSHPAYANRTAYIRNDEEIVAVDLAQPE